MGFKEKLQKKIEKNTVKSELSWTDGSGDVHTEEVLLKRSRLPLIGDWGRIYPPIEERGDGSLKVNWANFFFGGKKNLIKLIIIFAILGLLFFEMYGLLGDSAEFMGGDYVIVKKEAFDKFCSTRIYEEAEMEDFNGTLIFRGFVNEET